jgi:hypothetical protein
MLDISLSNNLTRQRLLVEGAVYDFILVLGALVTVGA